MCQANGRRLPSVSKGIPVIDLDLLRRDLVRKFGDDAAQHAILRVIERGWHETPGTNEVQRFARVVAKNFLTDQRNRQARHIGEEVLSTFSDGTNPHRDLVTREALKALDPIVVESAFYGQEECAKRRGIPVGTVKSKVSRSLKKSKRDHHNDSMGVVGGRHE